MGSNRESLDSNGRAKVQCKECEGWYHRLDAHVSKRHEMSAAEYREKYPGAPMLSESARIAAKKAGREPKATPRVIEPASSSEVCPPGIDQWLHFGCAKVGVRSIEGMEAADAQHIPLHDEGWELGANETKALEAIALGLESNSNVMIVGPPGVGKSTLAREMAAMANAPLRYLPINGEIRTNDLIGGDQLRVDPKTGQAVTRYEDGPLCEAAERGQWVLFDEFDSLPAHVGFVLHGLLEGERKLTRPNGQPLDFHPDFRVIATANTLGHGDGSGLYSGTAPMNSALLDRFGIVIEVTYPRESEEVKILVGRTGIKEATARSMVKVANLVREAQGKDKCFNSISPRRLIMWGQVAVKMGASDAAKISVLNRLGVEDREFVSALVQRFFG